MTVLKKDKIVANRNQLPALPVVVNDLLISFTNEDIDVGHIVRRIAQDQAQVHVFCGWQTS